MIQIRPVIGIVHIPSIRLLVAAMTLAAATGLPTLDGGGFSGTAQWLFVVLAGLALLSAAFARTVDGKAWLSPVTLTLAALAVLSILSATWTVGAPGMAVRAGLTSAGLAAVTLAAAALGRRAGPWPVAAVVAILAVLEALIGLHAVAAHQLPDAERIAGAWRPGGTFEYPPALALLQVAALPVLCGLLGRDGRSPAVLAAAGAVLAGAVLGLADSRLATVLAQVVLAALLIGRRHRASRRSPAVGVAISTAAGVLVSPILLHAPTGFVGHGSGMAAFGGMLALALLLGAAWTLTCERLQVHVRRGLTVGTTIAMCAWLALSAWPAGTPAHGLASPSRRAIRRTAPPRHTDWLHGRGGQWKAAVETWLDQPLLGAGAGAYFTASLRHQNVGPTLYAHDLPLEDAAELGVLGLLLALALYAAACWTLVGARRCNAAWLLGPLSLIFLVSNLLDWTWHLAGLGALWAAAAGTLHRAGADERGATEAGPGC